MTGGALGSDPATWSPVSKGGRMSLRGMRERGDLNKFGPRSGVADRARAQGKGACGRKGCCMGGGLYA